jgi:hypothetical protein
MFFQLSLTLIPTLHEAEISTIISLRNEPNVMVEWLTFLLHILEVLDSNISLETSYSGQDFPQSLKANTGIVL